MCTNSDSAAKAEFSRIFLLFLPHLMLSGISRQEYLNFDSEVVQIQSRMQIID